MQVFLIEDDPTVRTIFQESCTKIGVELIAAASLGEALAIAEDHDRQFDLAICDLKIPSVGGAVDLDVAHGLAALSKLQSDRPGVPVIVLSAFGTVDVISQMLFDARQVDIYGGGTDRPMLRFVQKAKLTEAVEAISEIQAEVARIEQIELHAPDLSDEYRRAVRVFARRKGGALVDYVPLAGGRSGARTGLATVRSSTGAQTAHAVSKLTTLERALQEKERYRRHISGRLSAATYTDLSDEVLAGCGSFAGLFYSVADNFRSDVFSVLERDSEEAAAVVRALQEIFAPWLAGAPRTGKTWLDVRRNLIADADYHEVAARYAVAELSEDRAIQTVWVSQHGDLHGANALVDETLRPVLIDYGRAGEAPSVLDPVTLELSAIFHPDSPFRGSSWPSVDDLAAWPDLSEYLKDCPYPEFVTACREWASSVRVGRRDLFATVSAYALRNLQYDDVDKDKALTLQRVSAGEVDDT